MTLQLSYGHVVTDVLVVGRGVSGMVCALEAQRLGLDVVIVERGTDVHPGGNSPISAQGFAVPTDPTGMSVYLSSISAAAPGAFDAWCQSAATIPAWLASFGGMVHELDGLQHADFAETEGATSFRKCHVGASGSLGLFDFLSNVVRYKTGIRVYFDHRIVRLNASNDSVTGATGTDSLGRETTFSARRGVVLACGGYALSLAREWDLATDGSPSQDGDAIRLAGTVGGSFDPTREYVGPYLTFRVPGTFLGIPLEPLRRQSPSPGSFIVVDNHGNRVADELAEVRHGFERQEGRWQRRSYPTRLWMIGDSKLLDFGPLHLRRPRRGGPAWAHDSDWTSDSMREAKLGWIHLSSDLAGLGQRLGMPELSLAESVNEWNDGCRAGFDRRWQRVEKLSPIDSEPYFAIELVPSVLNTLDGPRSDSSGRVLNDKQEAIRGLHIVGEASTPFTSLYQGATNLADCIVSGRRAAAALATAPLHGVAS